MTAVDGYDPSKGELVYNVGTRMSAGDLAAKTGLSVQRLISLNAEVFGDEHLDAGTMLKPGDTIDLVRVRLRVQWGRGRWLLGVWRGWGARPARPSGVTEGGEEEAAHGR